MVIKYKEIKNLNWKKILKYWAPVILYAALIFIISSLSLPQQELPGLPYLDKVLHLIEYSILGFLLYRAFINSDNKFLVKYCVLLTILTAVCYGLSDEYHQLFVPTREFDLYDVLFDGIGASISVFFLKIR